VLGGEYLLQHYGNLGKALSVAYPEHKWILGRFKHSPKNIWKDPTNVKDFIEYCAKELQIKHPEEWYRVSREQFAVLGGNNLLSIYGNLGKLLSVIYPNETWILGRFESCPKNVWKDHNNVREFLNYCKFECGIENQEDWYRISRDQISKLGGKHLLGVFGSLGKSLAVAYPELTWNLSRFSYKGH